MTWRRNAWSRAGVGLAMIWGIAITGCREIGADEVEATLPAGVRAVWDLERTQRESTPTRERFASTASGDGSRQ